MKSSPVVGKTLTTGWVTRLISRDQRSPEPCSRQQVFVANFATDSALFLYTVHKVQHSSSNTELQAIRCNILQIHVAAHHLHVSLRNSTYIQSISKQQIECS